MRYFANPAHKVETTEAGPPAWSPDKTPCPKGMTLRERTELLRNSIAEDPASPASRRFTVRRTGSGLEFFAIQTTQVVNGEIDGQLREFGVILIDSDVQCTQERMLAGSRRGFGAAAIVNRTPRTSRPWGRKFESARALGHLLLDPYRQDALGAASTAFAQPLARRRAGTFAAEFLLPSEALREDARGLDSYAEPERFEQVLERYGVGAQAAAYHLWNRGLLSSTQVRDELVEQFSNVERQ